MMLKEGSKAPAFKGIDQNGETIELKQFRGQKLVLYFYPHDNTPTCTTQACNLRDNFNMLKKKGFVVVGVSSDGIKSHKKFQTKLNLPFSLISDEDLKIHQQYGVWQLKKFMGREFMGTIRTTFLIDEQGKIRKIIDKPVSKDHARQITDTWSSV